MIKQRVFFALLFLGACSTPLELQAPVTLPARSITPENAYFDAVVDRVFDQLFVLDPTFATASGSHWYDAEMPDLSREGIEAEKKLLREMQTEIQTLELPPLSFDRQIDARLLARYLEARLFELEEVRSWQKNPMLYQSVATSGLYQLLSREFAPLEERFHSINSRLLAIPGLFIAAKANLETPPKIYCQKALQLLPGTLSLLRKTLPEAARELKDQTLQKNFAIANENAIKATEDFAAWLEKDLLPRSVDNFAYGKELFSRKLALDEWIELSPEEILRQGEQWLAQTQERYRLVAKKAFPALSGPSAAAAALHQEHAKNAEMLLQETRDSLQSMRVFLVEKQIVPLLNDEGLRVERQPKFLWGSASMDAPGPYEPSQEAYYYIDLPEETLSKEEKKSFLESYPRPIMMMISVHETYPGHYVQFLYQKNRVQSKTRKLIGSYHFGEGWAHYTEQMMLEEGFQADDPKVELAMLSESLLRICRLIAAVKLHTQNASIEEMTRFFQEEGFQDKRTSKEEAVRGTFDPMYLSYTIGKFLIYQLRKEVRQKEGQNFSLSSFHERLLSNGSLPVALHKQYF